MLIADGHYNLSNQISITKGIILRSANGFTNCIIDAQSHGRCLYANSASAVIDGLTITGGAPPTSRGLGAYIIGSTIKNCLVTGNKSVPGPGNADALGGGIYISGGLVKSCVVSNNYIEGGLSLYSWWSGFPGCIPVSGDFDGDGVSDLAVYNQSTADWYIIRSSDGQTITKRWGWSETVPVGASAAVLAE